MSGTEAERCVAAVAIFKDVLRSSHLIEVDAVEVDETYLAGDPVNGLLARAVQMVETVSSSPIPSTARPAWRVLGPLKLRTAASGRFPASAAISPQGNSLYVVDAGLAVAIRCARTAREQILMPAKSCGQMEVEHEITRGALGMVDTKMIKAVGEHWVCATLARHGWAPALTRDGIARTDILAVGAHLADRSTVEIQVKAATGGGDRTSWPLGAITQLVAASEHEWLVLVALPKFPSEPRAFVVPRDHVSAATWVVHQNWRTDPSAPEGKRNAGVNQARIQLIIWQGYENCWDLLGTPTGAVQVRLPGWIRERAQEPRVNLPPGHPWNEELPDW